MLRPTSGSTSSQALLSSSSGLLQELTAFIVQCGRLYYCSLFLLPCVHCHMTLEFLPQAVGLFLYPTGVGVGHITGFGQHSVDRSESVPITSLDFKWHCIFLLISLALLPSHENLS